MATHYFFVVLTIITLIVSGFKFTVVAFSLDRTASLERDAWDMFLSALMLILGFMFSQMAMHGHL